MIVNSVVVARLTFYHERNDEYLPLEVPHRLTAVIQMVFDSEGEYTGVADGNVISTLLWIPVDLGEYVSFYLPQEIGRYRITVKVKEDKDICYEGKDSATFFVGCEEAFIDLEINNKIIDEPVEFVLTIKKSDGTLLSGGEITSDLHLPDGSILAVSWSDEGDGTYMTQYTPSEIGLHRIRGTVTVLGEGSCFRGFFSQSFTVVEELFLPDLVIRNEDITLYPNPEVGEQVTIFVTVQNIGKANAKDFWVMVLITNEEQERLFVDSWHVDELAAGGSVTIKFLWKVKYSGIYYVYAIADVGEQEKEGII